MLFLQISLLFFENIQELALQHLVLWSSHSFKMSTKYIFWSRRYPAFVYFVVVSTTAHHGVMSWFIWIKSTTSYPDSKVHFGIFIPYTPWYLKNFLIFRILYYRFVWIFHIPYRCNLFCFVSLPQFDNYNIWCWIGPAFLYINSNY